MQVETVFPASDGTPMPAVLTVPDDVDGPVPGLLMIYEIFGMSDEKGLKLSFGGAPRIHILPGLYTFNWKKGLSLVLEGGGDWSLIEAVKCQ